MKPTENTFFFSFNTMRIQSPPPNEKVELLELPKSFDSFDLFDTRLRLSATSNGAPMVKNKKGTSGDFPCEGNPHLDLSLVTDFL